ncbi:hypothetical protein ACQ86G_16375 [Roseateles chitinivorans]|uniref:hypothetical protein n=1 Tax=Roseateles chitinivorans TaxID=2917965 RepID=UPI003D666DF6
MRWALVVALTVAYPLLVFASLGHVEPRYLALLLLVLGLLRLTVGEAARSRRAGSSRPRCCWLA